MAYKDEYEVARLYADPASWRSEGSSKATGRSVPPRAAAVLEEGREGASCVKKQYGPWMLPALRVLAKLKFLRGTALDVFGKTEERRMERALIVEYEALVKELIAGLTPPNLALAIELASLPDSMRGYGHVKDNNVQAAKTKWNALLARWREGQTARRGKWLDFFCFGNKKGRSCVGTALFSLCRYVVRTRSPFARVARRRAA